MNKEMLDKLKACKTAEEMKTLFGGRRQLSDSDVNQVVGGSVEKGPTPRTVYLYGQLIDEAGFNAIFINMTKTSGFDVAVKALYNMTGFSCNAMLEGNTTSPLDTMNVILYQFWLAIDEL